MADVMRSLVHLEPPRLVPLALDRFSPYHERPEASDWCRWGRGATSGFIHPTLDASTLESAGLHLRVPPRRPARARVLRAPSARGGRSLARETARRRSARCRYRRHRRGLTVTDRRPGLAATEYRLGGAEAAAYLACEDGATPPRIAAALGAAGFDLAAGALEDFLDECVAARLLHRDGAHYLALALPTSASAAAA